MYLSGKSLIVLGASVLVVLALNVRQSSSSGQLLDCAQKISKLVVGPLRAHMDNDSSWNESTLDVRTPHDGGVPKNASQLVLADNQTGVRRDVGRIRNR